MRSSGVIRLVLGPGPLQFNWSVDAKFNEFLENFKIALNLHLFGEKYCRFLGTHLHWHVLTDNHPTLLKFQIFGIDMLP